MPRGLSAFTAKNTGGYAQYVFLKKRVFCTFSCKKCPKIAVFLQENALFCIFLQNLCTARYTPNFSRVARATPGVPTPASVGRDAYFMRNYFWKKFFLINKKIFIFYKKNFYKKIIIFFYKKIFFLYLYKKIICFIRACAKWMRFTKKKFFVNKLCLCTNVN